VIPDPLQIFSQQIFLNAFEGDVVIQWLTIPSQLPDRAVKSYQIMISTMVGDLKVSDLLIHLKMLNKLFYRLR